MFFWSFYFSKQLKTFFCFFLEKVFEAKKTKAINLRDLKFQWWWWCWKLESQSFIFLLRNKTGIYFTSNQKATKLRSCFESKYSQCDDLSKWLHFYQCAHDNYISMVPKNRYFLHNFTKELEIVHFYTILTHL